MVPLKISPWLVVPIGLGAAIGLSEGINALLPSPRFEAALCPDPKKAVHPDEIADAVVVDGYTAEFQPHSSMTVSEMIKGISTPEDALRAARYLQGNRNADPASGYYNASLDEVLDGAPISCTEIAEVAATTLSDNGYRPLIVKLKPPRLVSSLFHRTGKACIINPFFPLPFMIYSGHETFLYRRDGKFYSLDMGREGFDTVEDLVVALNGHTGTNFASYCIYDRTTTSLAVANEKRTRAGAQKEKEEETYCWMPDRM